jgi:hypothetical protein
MKAIAKQNLTEAEIIKFVAGQKYNVYVDKDNYATILTAENGIEIRYCGEPKHLKDKFDFVEE